MKKLILPLFILLVLAQWAVPGELIWKKERVLKNGKIFRFETEPVDPSNPFEGKYIRLNFRADTFAIGTDMKLLSNQEIFAVIGQNKGGFAEIRSILLQPPASNEDYIRCHVNYIQDNPGSNKNRTIMVAYPFQEFYMDEYKAPRAEELYRSANRDSSHKTYAIVSVFNGEAVIKDVIINDRPIAEWFQ